MLLPNLRSIGIDLLLAAEASEQKRDGALYFLSGDFVNLAGSIHSRSISCTLLVGLVEVEAVGGYVGRLPATRCGAFAGVTR